MGFGSTNAGTEEARSDISGPSVEELAGLVGQAAGDETCAVPRSDLPLSEGALALLEGSPSRASFLKGRHED